MICDHEKGVPFAGTLFFLHDGRSSVICSVEVNFPVGKTIRKGPGTEQDRKGSGGSILLPCMH